MAEFRYPFAVFDLTGSVWEIAGGVAAIGTIASSAWLYFAKCRKWFSLVRRATKIEALNSALQMKVLELEDENARLEKRVADLEAHQPDKNSKKETDRKVDLVLAALDYRRRQEKKSFIHDW